MCLTGFMLSCCLYIVHAIMLFAYPCSNRCWYKESFHDSDISFKYLPLCLTLCFALDIRLACERPEAQANLEQALRDAHPEQPDAHQLYADVSSGKVVACASNCAPSSSCRATLPISRERMVCRRDDLAIGTD